MKEKQKDLKEEYYSKYLKEEAKGRKVARVILVTGLVIGGLYLSKYLFNGMAGTVRAFKNLTRAIKE